MGGDAERGHGVSSLIRIFAAMERHEWGAQAFDPGYFRARLADPRSVVLVLRTPRRAVAGFMIATPDDDVPRALFVEDTLIAKRHRGKRRVALLARALEREANRRGYRYLTRDAAIANGYADAIDRAYAGRILERRDHPSPYGRQRYFKIALAPRRAATARQRPKGRPTSAGTRRRATARRAPRIQARRRSAQTSNARPG